MLNILIALWIIAVIMALAYEIRQDMKNGRWF